MKGRPEHDRDDRRGFNANAALDASPRVAAQSSSAPPLGGRAGAPAPCRARAKERDERRGLFDPLRTGLRRQSNPTVDYFQYMVPTRGAERRMMVRRRWGGAGRRPNPRSTRVSAYARPTVVSTVDLCGRHRDISLKSESAIQFPPGRCTKIATGMQKTSRARAICKPTVCV